jgi:Na+/H+-dicarboxylate symporter
MEENTKKLQFNFKQLIIWSSAMVIGCALGLLGCEKLDEFFNFVASVYSRLFKFVAVPTIALAIATTMAQLGGRKNSGKIFLHTVNYTLLTTLAAAAVGAVLFFTVKPGNLTLPADLESVKSAADHGGEWQATTLYDHILNVVPGNIVEPFSSSNVLCIVLIAAAVGLAISAGRKSENVQMLLKGVLGLQEVFFTLIKALVWTLPVGIVAFSAQLTAMKTGDAAGSLGKYVLVVLGGNLLQFFIILPIFLLARRLNPLKVFRGMLPAVLMALFTKSSMATLPVTIASAENNLKAKPEVSRFVLPICCTINMNGCAAFILVTSLFVMQNGGVALTLGTVLLWILIAVLAAVGNAGVPMGCYFLTLSLMAGMNMPIWVLGLILPVYAVIDMIETAVNVWSDSCVCAMVDKSIEVEEEK